MQRKWRRRDHQTKILLLLITSHHNYVLFITKSLNFFEKHSSQFFKTVTLLKLKYFSEVKNDKLFLIMMSRYLYYIDP